MRKKLLLSIVLMVCTIFVNADPCTNIQTVTCGTTITFTSNGAGDTNWPNGLTGQGCNYSGGQGGQETIYQFTAPSTGYYQFQLLNASGGRVDYYWKPDTTGCSNLFWRCLDYADSPQHLGAVHLVASQTIYILANAEVTVNVNHIFQINCGILNCSTIQTVNCGDTISYTSSGYGDPLWPNGMSGIGNNYSAGQGGQETIYQFTATTTGYYQFQLLNASGGRVDYYWKPDTTGCSNLYWRGLDYANSPQHLGAVHLVASQTIYILANAEVATSINHIFQINCGILNCSTIQTVNCGDTISYTSSGYGDPLWPNGMNGVGCNYTGGQGGQETIYQFTATTTGYYQFQLLNASGGRVDYYWKPDTTGCSNLFWRCLDYADSPQHLGAVHLVASQTIYILANAEVTANVNHVFQINCGILNCSNIQTVSCGTPITYTSSGFGDPLWPNGMNGVGCNYTGGQGGQETIYRLPQSFNTYQINILGVSGGRIDFYWKYESLGCDNLNWNCIGYYNTTGNIDTFQTTPCSSVLLLVNSESISPYNYSFQVTCNQCPSGQLESAQFFNFSVSPNPTKSLLTINLSSTNPTNSKLEITNTIGAKVLETLVSGQSATVDVSKLTSGVYFVKLQTDKGSSVKKFIKE